MNGASLFGTDGIRAQVGSYPLDQEHIEQLSMAIAHWVQCRFGNTIPIFIGTDSRQSGSWIQSYLHAAFIAYGAHPINVGIMSTPGIYALAQFHASHAIAVAISASHNPFYDNGIKLMIAPHGKMSSTDAQMIEQFFISNQVALPQYERLGSLSTLAHASEIYENLLLSGTPPSFTKPVSVVLDCAHGATSAVAPSVFKRLGMRVIAINNKPNGVNINYQCGSLLPEQAQKTVIEEKADIGFCFDGDGDRVIAINRHGVVKNGDDILALLSNHPRYQAEATIVGTIMSNHGLATYFEQHHKKFIRTAVGDKYVAAALETHNVLLGGEQSGHIIMRNYLPFGDGIYTALMILHTMIESHNYDLNSFTHYPQTVINIAAPSRIPLHEKPIRDLIEDHQSRLSDGRIIVRYSGTEPVLRIMVECESAPDAQRTSLSLKKELEQIMHFAAGTV